MAIVYRIGKCKLFFYFSPEIKNKCLIFHYFPKCSLVKLVNFLLFHDVAVDKGAHLQFTHIFLNLFRLNVAVLSQLHFKS